MYSLLQLTLSAHAGKPIYIAAYSYGQCKQKNSRDGEPRVLHVT